MKARKSFEYRVSSAVPEGQPAHGSRELQRGVNVKSALRSAGSLRSDSIAAAAEKLQPRNAENQSKSSPMSAEPKPMPTTNPLLVLLSAPSGGGKTTIC